jgi:RimJ/RimL family protein N-acetyltransferase
VGIFNEPSLQLLYALLPQYAGKGFATEASRAVLGFTYSKLKMTYVDASTNNPNVASQKVAHRLGMQLLKKETIDGKRLVFFRHQKPLTPG